ncbi:DNA helicase/exodeoxyribonuclease V, beta subunit [Cyclonatronum proteinivorum]|uniref:DNA 3'-5' helicase n=1 Tax=Cyclonatronum proteinivorum TaxID=1457365 RepID=A0A345ULQ3_9BACT|nr:exodeoxyribonuclease V subunit beta [Cyclonatronum proteinivorum]AXJ01405.1 DNA helicase/exodeoxyribonuclease V, beta subunit [Cyclonatronum proteinivorum]
MLPFSIFDAPVSGLNLVESSAGTGKTYSITSLVVRFLAEGRVAGPGNLVVVTFTKAATQELRDRIAARIRQAAEVLRMPDEPAGDEFLEALRQQFGGNADALQNLERALGEFDQAAIYTIHGFCQQALQEYVFESGSRFDITYSGNDAELMQEAADDVWRSEMNRLTAAGETEQPLLMYLLAGLQTPDDMLALFRPLTGKPYLRFSEMDPEEVYASLENYRALAVDLLQKWDKKEVLSVISEAITRKDLKGNIYRQNTISTAVLMVDKYLLVRDWMGLSEYDQLEKFTVSKLQSAVSKKGTLPAHPFFDAAQAFLDFRITAVREAFCVRLYRAFLARFEVLKEQRRQRSFDDILIMARDAVRDNQEMRMRLRAQYPIALVDEFQDTDPVQLDIFRTLYDTGSPDHALYMIGDPKQSIYKFRGADINSYLQVRDKPGVNRFTLDKNFRSVRPMVDAVSALFTSVPGGEDGHWPGGIQFTPSQAHRSGLEFRTADFGATSDKPEPALHFLLPDDEVGEKENKDEAIDRIAHQAANEIARLLGADGTPAEVFEKEVWRKLRPGDIAVLVRDRYEAATFKKVLGLHGIKSVHRSSESVFQQEEAQFLLELLHLVRENARPAQLRAFLFRDEIGQRISDLQRMEAQPEVLSTVIDGFGELRRIFNTSGFTAMLRRFLNQEIGRVEGQPVRVRTRILSLGEGERIFTNLMHLNELIDAFEREHRPGTDALIKWLGTKISEAGTRDEEGEIRLDTDDDLVQIVTMHSSKGLEYPVVFCPSLWYVKSGGQRGLSATLWYEEGKTQADLTNFRAKTDEVRAQVKLEELAESLRLMYVALTRARLRCYVSVAAYKGSKANALAYVLRGEIYAFADKQSEPYDLADAAQALVQSHPELMQATADIPYAYYRADQEEAAEPEVLRPARELPKRPDWYVTSYSAIKKQGEKSTGSGYSSAETDIEGTKPDQMPAGETELGSTGKEASGEPEAPFTRKKIKPNAEQPSQPDSGIFAFPKGARPGTMIHRLFEELDFTRLAEDGPALVARCLADEGYGQEFAPALLEMLRQVLGAQLPESGARLAEKGPAQTVDELEFYFHLNRANAAEIEAILGGAPGEAAPVGREEGFMTGFIDLVFEHEGRFYIADYKSDWLGDAASDYGAEALSEAMQARGYALQYPIYLVALSRWLKSRLGTAFDYDRHIGGAYYLFVRGMTASGGETGIFFDRPDAAVITQLDHYFKGEGHAAGLV